MDLLEIMKKTLDEWKEEQIAKGNLWLSKTKPPELMGKWRDKYFKKKSHATEKGIEFTLTFEEYLELCYEAKLRSPAQIGTKPRNYHLGRLGDIGAYSKDNCRFITHIRNRKERDQHFCQSTHNKKLVADGTHNFLGQSPWNKPSSTDASLKVWHYSYLCYTLWVISKPTVSQFVKQFGFKSRTAVSNMLKKFEQGWNPIEDESWVKWKEICPNDLRTVFKRKEEKIHDNV